MAESMIGLRTRMDDIEEAIGNMGSNKSSYAEIDAMVAQYYSESLAAAAVELEFIAAEAANFLFEMYKYAGNSVILEAAIEVTLVDIQVDSFDFTSEQFNDGDENPGETLTISALVMNNTNTTAIAKLSGWLSLVLPQRM